MNTSIALLGPIGTPEMILIFIVVLLLFGAKKLPELARGIGKSMGEFKRAREDFEREITRSEVEIRTKEESKPRDLDPRPEEPRVQEALNKEPRES
jgi:sec-independent protein translocase protein TatA